MRETEPRGRRRGEAKEFKGNPRASGFVDEEESAVRSKKTQSAQCHREVRKGQDASTSTRLATRKASEPLTENVCGWEDCR